MQRHLCIWDTISPQCLASILKLVLRLWPMQRLSVRLRKRWKGAVEVLVLYPLRRSLEDFHLWYWTRFHEDQVSQLLSSINPYPISSGSCNCCCNSLTLESAEGWTAAILCLSWTADDNAGSKPKKIEDFDQERQDPCHSNIPEWLQKFRENLVDDEIPVHGDSHVSSSHEVSLERTFKRREDLGKHTVYTHFPQDRNCEICKRTKITRTTRSRRYDGVVQSFQCKL